MYILNTSDGQHTQIGTSNGNRQDENDGTFWITGWSDATRAAVAVGGSYLLSDEHGGNFRSVAVVEIGGAGTGGIRFELNT
ncbi:hypothetical protein [Microbulbifer epialgicus]|uniref:Uncharacterized protein n=1 Tax=Microbulbifer epialgicus TaxID=393907 RepID=A0ABV4P487_9GAMM